MEKLRYNGFCIDGEADNLALQAKHLWVFSLRDLDTKEEILIHPYRNKEEAKRLFLAWLDKYDRPIIAFHNGLGFDIFALKFLLDLDFDVGPDTLEGREVLFVDTFYLSMFLKPDRERHGIEYFSKFLGDRKMDFRQACIEAGVIPKDAPELAEFQQWSPTMDEYCTQDTVVGVKTFHYLMMEWETIYDEFTGELPAHFRAGQKAFFLMSCQEMTGWKFDIEGGRKLVERIKGMMEEIRADVEPKLPPRALKKSEEKDFKMPAKPFKMNGDYSSTWERFVEKHSGKKVKDGWEFYGEVYKPEAGLILNVNMPMEMANQDQMKDWFLENGWEPTLWNFKRGPDGKPMRDPRTRQLIKTSPKLQEQGKLCENLEAMEGPIVKQVVRWLSLRNRCSVLEGWLGNWRLSFDGRIGAGRTGIAATHRQKHNTVVNVPKADPKVLLGYEFRSLWISEEGFSIAAGDAAALEGRVQGHYCFKYDDGVTAEELLKGDVHSKNAFAFYGDIYEEVAQMYNSPDFNKDISAWKPYRNKSKNGFYAILYGAGAPKVASTLGIPGQHGKSALEKFWAANPGTKALKENLEGYWAGKGQEKYLPAIDGRILLTRKKSALLNTIFQSCGGIVMDYASLFMHKWLGQMHWDEKRRPYYLYKDCIVRRIGYFHDELEYECQDEIAEEVSKMIENAIAKAGEFLKVKVPLVGEGKVGKSWKEVH